MKRAGFTMIELIFVIVILGILSAVALPKFIGVSNQAKQGQVKAFVGTLNRTVGPTLWSKSLTAGNNGSITSYCANMATYTDIPAGMSVLSTCDVNLTASAGYTGTVTFIDGNATNAPSWTYAP